MKSIALLYGGRSSEHDVSVVSAAGVLRALSVLGEYTVVPIGIARDGHWYLQSAAEQVERAVNGTSLSVDTDRAAVAIAPANGFVKMGSESPIAIDCVFPVLHGSFGEDGTMQGLLEIAGVPYVGSGVVGSGVGMDKVRSKRLWDTYGLPIVPYVTYRIRHDDPLESAVREITTAIESAFGFPVFVKPNAAGSSVGVSRVTSSEDLPKAVQRARAVDPVLLIEEALPVREIETAVIGNDTVRSFPPGEVIPSHEFYDYEAKYEDPEGARLQIPADLPVEIAEEIQRVSRVAFQAVDGAGFARVDCFVHKESSAVYVNEINTIPGFTPISMFPKMVEAGGISYGELLVELISLAERRASEQNYRDFGAR